MDANDSGTFVERRTPQKERKPPPIRVSRSRSNSKLEEDPKQLFELLERLGKGTYGEVYKAKQLKTGEVVAIKIIALYDERVLEEVRKEVEELSELNHPNIVRYFGTWVSNENLWIAMEYCGGGSISELCQITESGLNEDQIAFALREALKGLKYLHSMKKVHRDIKGSNILLTETGDVKLADFGISVLLFNTFSRRNTFVGAPYWMAPESIDHQMTTGEGGKHDVAKSDIADIWSIGITAIEMAEILPPNSNVHPMRVLFMIPRGPPPQLKEKKSWSANFHDFLNRCLVKDPSARADARELLKHKFLQQTKSKEVLDEVIDNTRKIIAERGYKLREDDDEDVTSYEDSESGSEVSSPAHTLRGNTAEDEEQPNLRGSGSMRVHPEAEAELGTMQVKSTDFGTFVERKEDRPEKPAKSKQKKKATGNDPNKRIVHLQDQLQAIYKKDCTIRIPFLNLNYISPSSLLYSGKDDEYINSTLNELCSDNDMSLTMESITSKTTLGNLVATLAYHKRKHESVPMSVSEIEQNSRIIRELNSTLKTIIRL